MSNYRILIYRDIEIEYIPIEDSLEYQEIIKEIGEPHITSVDNDNDAEQLLSSGAWEMSQKDVTSIFGDKVNLVSDLTCQISGDKEQGYHVVFTPPKETEEDLTKVKEAKVQEAIIYYNRSIDALAKDYPINEKITFDQQMYQANKLHENINAEDTEVVRGIAKGRNLSIKDMVPKILKKVKAFQYPAGVYLGRKQRIQDLVSKAKTIAEIQAIDVEKIFSEPLV